MLIPKEVSRIRMALDAICAGEPESGWPDDAIDVMRQAIGKLDAEPERTVWLPFSKAEARAAIAAVSQMTDGNARDYAEWRKQTHGSLHEWQALLRAEAKLKVAT